MATTGRVSALALIVVLTTRIATADEPVQDLRSHLKTLYPEATLQATTVGNAVLLRGTVQRAEHIKQVVEIAEQFFPKVLNQIELAPQPVGVSAAEPPAGTTFTPFRTPAVTLTEAPPPPLASIADPQMLPRPAAGVAGLPDFAAPQLAEIKDPQTIPTPPPAGGATPQAFAPPAKPAASNTDTRTDDPFAQHDDSPQSIRELRKDVKALRQDVQRLIGLLEKRTTSAVDPPPESARAVPAAAVVPTSRTTQKADLREKQAAKRKQILESLEKTISFDQSTATIADFCKAVSDACDVNVIIDQRGLEEEGLTTATQVRAHIKEVKAGAALKLGLESHGLTWLVEDGVVKVTSRQRAKGPLIVCSYPVADLVCSVPNVIGAPFAQDAKGGDARWRAPVVEFDPLISLIGATVEPMSWDMVGGPGSVRPHEATLSLVIRQTQPAHEQIGELLRKLRRLQDLQVTIRTVVLIGTPKSLLEKAGIPEQERKRGSMVLDEKPARLLIDSVRSKPTSSAAEGVSVTLFNGQGARLSTRGIPEHTVQSVVSADRRSVRLSLQFDDKGAANGSRQVVERVPDGKWALVDVTPASTETAERTYLLLAPRIVVQQEEEELLGIPSK